MNRQIRGSGRRLLRVAAVLVMLTSLWPVLAVGAAESGDVTITASVNNRFLTVTLCEPAADFGTGLNAKGAAATGTTDDVVATSEGTDPGQGVFYRWSPNSDPPPCSATFTDVFVLVDSSHTFTLTQCASENSGSNPDLRVADGDLRAEFDLPAQSAYDAAASIAALTVCPTTSPGTIFAYGYRAITNYIYLRVSDDDDNGTFASTLTVMATQ